MTSPQRTRLYFPAWQDAVRANWTCSPMRLLPSPTNPGQARRIHRLAAKLARDERVAMTGDHLRHAVHIIVLGADKSCRDLTNTEIDSLLATFRQLAGATGACRPGSRRPSASVVAPRRHTGSGRRSAPGRPQHIQPQHPTRSDSPACETRVPTAGTHAPIDPPTHFNTRDFDPYASVPVGRGPLGSTRTGD